MPQALLVGDRRDGVDHVAVPPHGVAGHDVGDADQGGGELRVPPNPAVIVLGGTWHDEGGLADQLAERLEQAPVPAEVRRAEVRRAEVVDASIRGASLDALDRARDRVLPAPA